MTLLNQHGRGIAERVFASLRHVPESSASRSTSAAAERGPGRAAPGFVGITPTRTGWSIFLRLVFEAQGDQVPDRPVELKIGDSIVMVSDGGELRSAMPGFLYVYVADTNATFQAAIATGAVALEPPGDMPSGDRRRRWGTVAQP